MMRKQSPVLYLITALATLFAGTAFFTNDYAAPFRRYYIGSVSLAILNFAAPVFFILASASSIWTKGESNRARWVTIGAVLIIFVPLIHFDHGWKPYAGAVGGLICLVYVHDSLVRRSSAIAISAAATYGITQGVSLYFWLLNYWDFGGSIANLLAEITPLFLVTVSLLAAITSHPTVSDKTIDKGQTP
jgi:hypothetical protein